jgi:hypothetical protein
MFKAKPQLLPVEVPWQISPSVANLRLELVEELSLGQVTFIGHFKFDEPVEKEIPLSNFHVIPSSPEFELSTISVRAPFRLVRVNFIACFKFEILPAVSDLEIIQEEAYDWSKVPGSLLPSETIEENIERTCAEWLETKLCPDPGMYEVKNSPWLAELGEKAAGLKHYILLGSDEYLQVIAKQWKWEIGQPVD